MYNFKNNIMPKSHFKLIITTVNEVSHEGGDKHFQIVDEEIIDYSGNQFKKDFLNEIQAGKDRTIEIVNEKPVQWRFNQLYMLPTRDRMWVWVLADCEE